MLQKKLNNSELRILLKWQESIESQTAIPNLIYERITKPGGRGDGKEQWIIVLPKGGRRCLLVFGKMFQLMQLLRLGM